MINLPLRQLALQYMALHRATAKLCYVCTSLFSGLVQEGFCMPSGVDGERACAWCVVRAGVRTQNQRVLWLSTRQSARCPLHPPPPATV